MDRGTEQSGPGRVPLAVVVVDRDGLVSHWSRGARRLFARPAAEAVGRTASDLLPVSGALPDPDHPSPPGSGAAQDGPGPDPESPRGGRPPCRASGRARLTVPGGDRVDVLWWAYPLVDPGRQRLLVLAADAGAVRPADGGEPVAPARIAPAFAPRTGAPGADELVRHLPGTLPGMSAGDSARIVDRVLELGCPALDLGRDHRVAVTPDWGASRRTARQRTARTPYPDRSRRCGTRNRP